MVDQTNTSIFNQETATPVPEITPAPKEDPSATLLASILAEDGRQKYATVEDAIKSISHSQEHIRRLEQETAALNEEIARRKTAEEVLEEIKATKPVEATPSPGIDYSQVESLVDQRLQATEQRKVASDNTSKVVSVMSEKFGDKAEEVFIKTAQDSGISVDQLNALAASSPMAVLKLVGVEAKAESSAPFSSGSVNTESLRSPASQTTSAKVPPGAGKDVLMAAWRAAGQT